MAPDPSPRHIGRPDAVAIALALFIGSASILSAVIAWRASLAAVDASRLESLAVQQQARQQQLELTLEAIVLQDERLLAVFQEHALAARELQAQADAVRATDLGQADSLDLEAHGRLALTRSIQPFFRGASGIALDEEGSVVYDRDFVLRNLRAGDLELRELRAEETLAQAEEADARTMVLLASAAIIVAALFFLTIAQVSRQRRHLRYSFFAVGGMLTAAGALSLVLVEFRLP